MAFLGQRALEPRPARTGFRDKEALRTFRGQLTEEWIASTWAGTKVAKGDDRGVVVWGDLGDRHRIFRASQTDGECARLVHG
jgi:hypothetical protein